MRGATLRRSAVLAAAALVALAMVAPGLPGHSGRADGTSTVVASLQPARPATPPILRRQTVVTAARLAAHRAGSGRGGVAVVLSALLLLLAMAPATELRSVPVTWRSLAHRRHSISLRAPPPLPVG